MNKLKEKIKKGEKTCGTIVNMGDVCVSDIISRMGYDFIWIDFEHSYLSYEQMLTHITVAKANGTSVIVRVPQDDLTATKKALEMGIDGIIFPMVKTKKEICELMEASLYPPDGNRGFGPMAAINYGLCDAKAYVKDSNKDICRFIQIECHDLIENLDEIMENDFIDGYIFGPNDLSGSINELLDVYGENTERLMKTAIEKLKSKNKYVGVATGSVDREVVAHWHSMGIDMISAGADYVYLLNGAKEMLDVLKDEHLRGK